MIYMNLKNPPYCDYLCFYQRQFSLAYRHLVNTKHDKNPYLEVVLGGIDKSLRHLANSCDADQNEKVVIHLELALDTLREDTYTCYKITTLSINDELKAILNNSSKARHCIDNYEEFVNDYNQFLKLCQKAKEEEDKKTDIGCKAAIKAYEDAIALGERLKNEINPVKKAEFEQNIKKEQKENLQEEAPSFMQKIKELHLFQTSWTLKILGLIIASILFLSREFIIALIQGFFQDTAIPYLQQLILK